jgi:tRNA pseudouridine32 synthase/23S rRNA pseudouridine746 synthase
MINMVDDFIAPPCHDDITILYQDEAILVINKPSGLLSLSGKNPLNKDSVHYRLVKMYPSALLVHRLDFGTSGIMLVALSKDIVKTLNQQFSNRQVSKTYVALLHGDVMPSEGVIDYPIAKGEFPRQKICTLIGKPAQSAFEVLERLNGYTRVCFKPLTGRTHQLRIHSLAFGHPILGCDLYANEHSTLLAKRLMLHASGLSFDHPVTGQKMLVESPCPF